MLRKAFDLEELPGETRRNQSIAPLEATIGTRGVQGDSLIEPVPNYNARPSEKVYQGANNTWIVMGRDRPGEQGSGYGDQTKAGTIDIVVGRMSSDIQTTGVDSSTLRPGIVVCDNNLALDASRIYISQKTDVDANFNLVQGKVGNSYAKAAIAIKSDAVRIVGREGVKIVTGVDSKNSAGGNIVSVPGIDLIAGNDDSKQEPVTKADTLAKVLKNIFKSIDDLNSSLDAFLTSQVEFNSALMSHTHPDVLNMFIATMATQGQKPLALTDGATLQDPAVLQAGLKAVTTQNIIKADVLMQKMKAAVYEEDGTEPYGSLYPGSRNVTTS